MTCRELVAMKFRTLEKNRLRQVSVEADLLKHKNSENIDTSINKNIRCKSECVVPLRKE